MKRISLKKWKIMFGLLGATGLIVPIVAVSAVSCSLENLNSSPPIITLTTQPQNATAFVNQTTNLPKFTVIASAQNKDVKLTYQWYKNSSSSTTGESIIPEAISSAYQIPSSATTQAGTFYYYVVVTGKISSDSIVTISSAVTTITSKPVTLTVSSKM